MSSNETAPGAVRPLVAIGSALKAAIPYSLLVFAAGFALGAFRTRLLVPRLGETAAVLVELPVMLSWSWLVCGLVIHWSRLLPGFGERALFGALAFLLLMLAEFALAALAFSRSPVDFFAGFTSPAGAIGLIGQVAFGLFPVLQRR